MAGIATCLSPRHRGIPPPPMDPSLGRGCQQEQRERGRPRMRALLRGCPGTHTPLGGLGAMYPPKGTEGYLLCRSASSRKAKAPPRGCGSVRGSPWARGGAAAAQPPGVQRRSEPGRGGDMGTVPMVQPAGLVLGAIATAFGGGCTGAVQPGEIQLPGRVRRTRGGGGSSREPQGSSPRGGGSWRRCWRRVQLLLPRLQRGGRRWGNSIGGVQAARPLPAGASP